MKAILFILSLLTAETVFSQTASDTTAMRDTVYLVPGGNLNAKTDPATKKQILFWDSLAIVNRIQRLEKFMDSIRLAPVFPPLPATPFISVRESSGSTITVAAGDNWSNINSTANVPVTVLLTNQAAGICLWVTNQSGTVMQLSGKFNSKSNLKYVQARGTVFLLSRGAGIWNVYGDLR